MHIKSRSSTIDKRCAICSSINTEKKTNHVFDLLECKDCGHQSLITEQKKHDRFMQTHIKKFGIKQQRTATLINVLEYSYCPYWEAMTLIHKTGMIKIRTKAIPGQAFQAHYFTEKSVKIFAEQLGLPMSLQTVGDSIFVVVNILRYLPR